MGNRSGSSFMKRQKERARMEKQREKAERKRVRREEAKNRVGGEDSGLDNLDNPEQFQPGEEGAETPAAEQEESL
jgi:hypothetical protein